MKIIKILTLSLSLVSIIACDKKRIKIDNQVISTTLNSLKSNQAIADLYINNKQFYADDNIFSGNGSSDPLGLKISLKDQFFGNIIISLEGENWQKKMPIAVKFRDGVSSSAFSGSFLVGKLIDKENQKGEGYMFYEGSIDITEFSSDRFVLTVNGKVKKPFGDENLYPIEGNIIWKKPNLAIYTNQK